MKPTRDQVLRYIEERFRGQHIAATREVKLRCPFHDDKSPSLTFNTEDGVWCCHAGCGAGGLIDFEQRVNGGSREEARLRMEEVMGAEHLFESQATKPVAIYPYHDSQGRLLFEKCRYEPKRFVQRRPLPNGGYEYKLDGVPKPLYRLPEILRASAILVCEGEKDADRVASLKFEQASATTNFDGASGNWPDRYSVYFAGKKCVIFVDNDDKGRAHAQRVAESVSKYAVGVKVIELAGLPEHGDVSDWLDAGHTAAELVEVIRTAPGWKPIQSAHVAVIEAMAFGAQVPSEIDFLVEWLIPRGANGLILAEPKSGKSMAALDLALAVATGTPWLGFKVPRRVKCALISREDYPGMTAQRLGALFRGTSRPDLEGWLWINTRWQTPLFQLEDDAAVNQLIAELKMEQVEFAVFDVFRRIHSEDENDNTEMQRMLDQLTRIQTEVGCAIALVHHVSKGFEGSMFRHARGASAIDGWTEWAMAISIANPEKPSSEWIRKIEFETKASSPAAPVYFRIVSANGTMRLERASPDPNSVDYLEGLLK
jgi:5S rRNA maturation endonuclease (ribonuclease M5)